MYVVLEGVDGAGKSTQVGLLKTGLKTPFLPKSQGGQK